MLSNSDLIVKIIRSKGFTPKQVKQAMGNNVQFYVAIRKNIWSTEILADVGRIIGEDLMQFVNAKISTRRIERKVANIGKI
jgi:hypothetical protein